LNIADIKKVQFGGSFTQRISKLKIYEIIIKIRVTKSGTTLKRLLKNTLKNVQKFYFAKGLVRYCLFDMNGIEIEWLLKFMEIC
jgi:recombinational DNA repair protein RecR